MTDEYSLRQIDLRLPPDREALISFLSGIGLKWEKDVEAAFGLFDSSGELCGCGCAAGRLLKCFGVSEELRGQNALGLLASALQSERFSRGFYDLAVITRLHNRTLFENCGFHTIAAAAGVVLLENRAGGPERFARTIADRAQDTGSGTGPGTAPVIGAAVMNCNPFTLGHRTLVEYAAAHCDRLYLFVVEEDRSEFSFRDRLRMVQEGTADLPGVIVTGSGPYMISQATFPTYFLKAGEDAAAIQSTLDITIFAERIAPLLGITKRFAGQEPLDPVTAKYNDAMRKLLPGYGIKFCEIPRRTAGNSREVISASAVRRLYREKGLCPELLEMVPESTAAWLRTHPDSMREKKSL